MTIKELLLKQAKAYQLTSYKRNIEPEVRERCIGIYMGMPAIIKLLTRNGVDVDAPIKKQKSNL